MSQLAHSASNWSGSYAQTTISKTYTFPTASKYVDKDIALTVNVSDANLTAGNIKKDVSILGTTGTLDYVKTVTSVPSTKDTSVIYNSTNGNYYLWR